MEITNRKKSHGTRIFMGFLWGLEDDIQDFSTLTYWIYWIWQLFVGSMWTLQGVNGDHAEISSQKFAFWLGVSRILHVQSVYGTWSYGHHWRQFFGWKLAPHPNSDHDWNNKECPFLIKDFDTFRSCHRTITLLGQAWVDNYCTLIFCYQL
jgi:hypothetical protein